MATSSALDTIPATATCTFVGEGRANIVFHLTTTATTNPPNPAFTNQLLRLPKHTPSTAAAIPYPRLQHYWETSISPLFAPTELVQQRLVRLPASPAFVNALNAQLRALDASGTRRKDFVGHVVAEDVTLGMLVQDMRSSAGSKGMRMHEIKPKWLHQSPRAPRGATQCRNCAREVWRNMKNGTAKPIFCPLNLVKGADFGREEGVVRDIARDLRRCFGDKQGMTEVEACHLAGWLGGGCELFTRLRRIQWDNDGTDVVGTDDEAYSLAMTLRDCSLFVLVPNEPDADGEKRVVARLGDTDMKNFAVKKDYWIKMEKEFHDSGVYWNTDKLSKSLTACQLPFYRERLANGANPELARFYMV